MDFNWKIFEGTVCDADNFDKFFPDQYSFDVKNGRKIDLKNGLWSSDTVSETPETALLFSEFVSESNDTLAFGTGACYFFRVFLNGELIFDRSESGNKPYPIPPSPDNFIFAGKVRQGKNLIAVALKSAPGAALSFAFRGMDDMNGAGIVPSVENFQKLAGSERYPEENSAERKNAYRLIQNGVLMMRNTIFNPYSDGMIADLQEIERLQQEYPILYFYEKAFDRIIEEVKNTFPAPNEVVMWHLYNMGYVVKTAETTFGIDINHRRGVELEPLLDFVMTTHNHSDHQCIALFRAMTANNKMVITNFHAAPGFHRPPAELEVGGVKINTWEHDHNPTLKKFVAAFYIQLPNGCTIYATGDSREVVQLNHLWFLKLTREIFAFIIDS